MSHAIYLPEAELQVALRTATQTLPLAARQRKAKRGVKEVATANHVVYLLLHSESLHFIAIQTRR
ncbi:hypothetical protein [Pilibacter termitis]|uniref:hypothetical protein n=1 Tax=Pilibacter termitis TaxID=263852 RepID=UPI0011869AAF|nr:hypothetical protein [Pilibacter termitis]